MASRDLYMFLQKSFQFSITGNAEFSTSMLLVKELMNKKLQIETLPSNYSLNVIHSCIYKTQERELYKKDEFITFKINKKT